MGFDMKILMLTLLAAAVLFGSTAQAKVYRWVDENGEVHYSETLPPNFEEKKHDVLDDAGITRQTDQTTVPPPPLKKASSDKGELPRDSSGMQRPEPLFNKAQMEQQQNALLLLRYDSDQEIIDAMEVEINQLAYDERLLTGSRTSMQGAYRGNIREAAERQRAGKAVEPALEKEIRSLQQRLAANAQSIDRLKVREAGIRADFEEELQRYRKLVAEVEAQES